MKRVYSVSKLAVNHEFFGTITTSLKPTAMFQRWGDIFCARLAMPAAVFFAGPMLEIEANDASIGPSVGNE